MEWSVLLEVSAPKSAMSIDAEDESFDRLLDLLTPYGAVVGITQDGRGYSVRLTIDCHADLRAVLEQAVGVVEPARRKVKLPAWPMTRGEIVRADELAREISEPNFPDVVGTSEVSSMLEVSRQRLHELRNAGTFPEPMVELAAGPLWLRTSIESFLAGWKRKPGRPRLSEMQALVARELKNIPRGDLWQNMYRSCYQQARLNGQGKNATIAATPEAAHERALAAVREVNTLFVPILLSTDAKQPPPSH